MARAPHGNNQPPPVIIVKKIVAEGHGGHHGGAWKVAYADFVTAMMAFFLLMWLLGATTEKQRKGLADFFAPTLVEVKAGSAGDRREGTGRPFSGKPSLTAGVSVGRTSVASRTPTRRAPQAMTSPRPSPRGKASRRAWRRPRGRRR